MQTLLFFEECEGKLSHQLFNRKDIDFVILRTNKNEKFFSKDYLEYTSKFKVFVADFYSNIEDEIKRFKKWCKDNNIVITNFLNDSEYYLEYANNFANLLGLESLNQTQINWVRDKVDMKKRFNEIDLNTVKYSPVESKEDIKRFFTRNGSKRIVFKPRRSMNSIEVFIIDSLEDIENLLITFKPNKYMVETFCYDREWSIESLVQDGIVLDSYLTFIPNPTIWASIANDLNCHMTVPIHPSYFKFKAKDLIQKIVTGMNLKNGVMTIEVFIDEFGNVLPSELGWRLPGCQATTNHSYSYGINIYDILIDIMLHKKVELKYRDKIMSVGDLYLPNKDGVVTHITSLEELLSMNGVIDAKMNAKIGENIVKRRVGNDSSGWVQVMGTSEVDTLEKMLKIFDNYIIETKKEGVIEYEKKY